MNDTAEHNNVTDSDALQLIKGFMFDLDGTLLLSDRSLGGYQLLPGAVEVLHTLQQRGLPFVVLTNGSAYRPADQAAKLRQLDLPVDDTQMLTPSSVAADVMVRRKVRRALVLGTRGVGAALAESGIEVVFTGEPHAYEVDAVFVGWHPDCTMRDIETACNAIWQGAKLYVASDVPFFATQQGRTMGYSHAISGAIRKVTRAPIILTGKPSSYAMSLVARRLRLPAQQVGVVGDDSAVEIVMARRAGAMSFGVTTGVTSLADWSSKTGLHRPHRVLTQLGELLDVATIEWPQPISDQRRA